MGTVTVQGRDELGRLIDVTLTTAADVAPPGPEVVTGGAGGGGVTVDNTVDAPFSADTLIAAGATESAPGEATLASGATGFVLAGVLTLNTPQKILNDGFGNVPVVTATHDPDGYYAAVLPDNEEQGFAIPAIGDGLLHRVTFVICIQDNDVAAPGAENASYFTAYINNGITTAIGDTRLFVADLDTGIGAGQGVTLTTSWVGVMSEDDEVYVQCRTNSGPADIGISVLSGCVTIERLLS